MCQWQPAADRMPLLPASSPSRPCKGHGISLLRVEWTVTERKVGTHSTTPSRRPSPDGIEQAAEAEHAAVYSRIDVDPNSTVRRIYRRLNRRTGKAEESAVMAVEFAR